MRGLALAAGLLALLALPGAPRADPLKVTLYLRADGALGLTGRGAIEGAIAALARLPGAALAIYVEPRDRNAPLLAEALAAAGSDGLRARLLGALLERDHARWVDANAIELARRAVGMPSTVRSTQLPGGARFLAMREPSAAARALLRRPEGMELAGRSFVALGARAFTAQDLDELARGESLPDDEPRAASVAARGFSGREVRLVWDQASPPCELLPTLAEIAEDGRARVLVLASPGAESHPLDLALRVYAPSVRVAMVKLLCGDRDGLPDRKQRLGLEQVAWVVQAVGADPAALVDAMERARAAGPAPPQGPSSGAPQLLFIDGVPASRSDLANLKRPRSLRARLSGAPRRPER